MSAETEIKKTVNGLKRYPNVSAIVLFGSYIKKKTKPLSDIDIAVISKKPDKKTEAEVASFSSDVFDVVNFHRLPLYIQFEVLKHGKPVFVRNKRFFFDTRISVLRGYLEVSSMYERMTRSILA